MKILSKTTIYGIRAALFVASTEKDGTYVPIRQISEELGISFSFLTKVLRALTQHNLMASHRGSHGGVSLARPAKDISLMDMIDVMESESCLDGCILGLNGCGEGKPCPLHEQWGGTREDIRTMFEDTNLEDLGRKIREGDFRLTM